MALPISMSKSTTLEMIWEIVVMIVGPPPVPVTSFTRPMESSRIVGVIDERIRFPGSMALASPCTRPNLFGFPGLAAYDAQRLKVIALQTPGDRSTSNAVVGALALYLDFTNLFLFLLRFTGNRRQ